LLPLVAAAMLAPAHAADRYEGAAYDRAGRVVYRETHWRYTEADRQQRLVLYRCPDGRPFARKQMRWQEGAGAAPDFDFLDQRDGYREGLRSRAQGREVYWQGSGPAPERSEQVQLGPDAVADAGFDSFVRRRWDDLVAGRPVHTAFLIPGDFDAVPVVIRLAADAAASADSSAVTFAIVLDRWYAFAAPTTLLTYGRADRWLREFRGTGTIRDERGRRQAVRVEFPADGRQATVAAGEIEAAAAEPLADHCREP